MNNRDKLSAYGLYEGRHLPDGRFYIYRVPRTSSWLTRALLVIVTGWLLYMLAGAACAGCRRAPPTEPRPKPEPWPRQMGLAASPSQPGFIIGVWQQPAGGQATTWRERGITHIFTDAPKPANATAQSYVATLQEKGIGLYMQSPAPPATVMNGFMYPDEPENWGAQILKPDGINPDWPATIKRWRAAAPPNLPASLPRHANFNGGPLLSARDTPGGHPRNPSQQIYKEFLATPGLTSISADFYVAAQGRPRTQYANLATIQERLSQYAPQGAAAPRRFGFIETCDQGLPNPGARHPTPADIRAQAWIQVVHGATGIIYFPLKVQGGFSWDNTPAESVAALRSLNKELTDLSPYLLKGTRTTSTPGPGPSFRATWRLTNPAPARELQVAVVYNSTAPGGGAWEVSITAPADDPRDARIKMLEDKIRRAQEALQ